MSKALHVASLASKILSSILSTIDDHLFLFENPRAVLYTGGDIDGARLMLQRKNQKLRSVERKKFYRSLSSLQQQNYLHIRTQGEEIYLSLTQKGIQEGIKRIIREKKKHLKKEQRCYVSFDIPESFRAIRYTLRHLLKEAGFSMIQLSLWSTRKDVGKELAVFVMLIGAQKWVHVFVATPIVSKKTSSNKNTA